MMFMCAHVYDVALCGNTVRNVALGLSTPDIYKWFNKLFVLEFHLIRWRNGAFSLSRSSRGGRRFVTAYSKSGTVRGSKEQWISDCVNVSTCLASIVKNAITLFSVANVTLLCVKMDRFLSA